MKNTKNTEEKTRQAKVEMVLNLRNDLLKLMGESINNYERFKGISEVWDLTNKMLDTLKVGVV